MAKDTCEFDVVREKGVTVIYHQGSDQPVFTASCTLEPADLMNPYLYDYGVLYDIRGHELFKTKQVYDAARPFSNGYALVRNDNVYGLIDMQDNEVIPPQYEEMGNTEDDLLSCGYISAVKNGKFGFLDAKGQETCSFAYSNDEVRNYGSFATINNPDGSIIVLSAAVGEFRSTLSMYHSRCITIAWRL